MFTGMVEGGAFLEHALVFGNHYGTPKEPVMLALAKGQDVLFDIDWQGTQQLRQQAGDDLVSIFVLPPSHDELERRLRARAQDAEDVVAERMARANNEISHWAEYDYVVINDDLDATLAKIQTILAAERMKRGRQTGIPAFVSGLNALASAANCATSSCSGRAVGSMPAFSSSASPPRGFRLWRSILRRWPKAAAVTVSSFFKSAGATGSGNGSSRTMEEVTEGGGTKALRFTSNRIFACVRHGRQHRQPAIMFAAGLGGDALGDFALEHQGEAGPEGRPAIAGQPFDQQRRCRHCKAGWRRCATPGGRIAASSSASASAVMTSSLPG